MMISQINKLIKENNNEIHSINTIKTTIWKKIMINLKIKDNVINLMICQLNL